MSKKVNKDGETKYPFFLQLCVDKKVIGKNIIEKIEQYNNKTNVGMIRTLRKLNLISQDKMLKKFMTFLNSVSDPKNYEPLFFDIFPKPDKTLKNYFLFEANNILHHFVDLIISGQKSNTFNHSLLYIYGKNGNGKTHLLSAITNDVKARSALMVSAADLEIEYERAVSKYSPNSLAQVLNPIELLIIEDIEHCGGNPGFQKFVYELLMKNTSEKNNVIVSSTVKPVDLKDIDSKLLSFLEESEVFEMKIGEKSECIDLLHQIYNNGELTPEAIEMLTEHFKDDVGQLLGAAEQYLGILEKDKNEEKNKKTDNVDAKNIVKEKTNNNVDAKNIEEKKDNNIVDTKKIVDKKTNNNVEAKNVDEEKTNNNVDAKNIEEKKDNNIVDTKKIVDKKTITNVDAKNVDEEKTNNDVGANKIDEEKYNGNVDIKNIEEENENYDNDIDSIVVERAESQVDVVNQNQVAGLVDTSHQELLPTSKENSPENSKKDSVETKEVKEVDIAEKTHQPKEGATTIIASQFKKMLVEAKTENELTVVLKFAFEEKLGQLSNNGSDAASRQKLEQALRLLDSGNVREAVQCAGR